MMAAMLRAQRGAAVLRGVGGFKGSSVRSMASVGDRLHLQSDISLQKARTWDEGVQTNFSVSSLQEIFQGKKVIIFGLPGAYTGVCTKSHVPSFVKNAGSFKEKGIDEIICVAVNDPYVMNGWAEKLQCKDKISFYGDVDGKFHKFMKLEKDLSSALLGPRSERWSAYVDNGEIKILNVEEQPGNFEVSGGDIILQQLKK